jgi:hypothetical protein
MPSVNMGKPARKSGQYRPPTGGGSVATVPKDRRSPPTPMGGPWKLVDPSGNKSRWLHLVTDLSWRVPAQVPNVEEDVLADGQMQRQAGYWLSENWMRPDQIRTRRRPDP